MSTEEGRTAYAKACAEFLKNVREPVDLENYLKRLSLESGFDREVLLQQIGAAPVGPTPTQPKRESFRYKAREAAQVDWTGRTLLAVVATGKLPPGSVTPEDFDDPVLQTLCKELLHGESPASLMEQQPDELGRSAIGDILSINTDMDDDGLMRMAQDCLKKMRRARLEKELDKLQKSMASLPQDEQAAAMQRALELTKRISEQK